MNYEIEEFEMFGSNWRKRLEYLTDIITNCQSYDKKNHSFPDMNEKLIIKCDEVEDEMALKDTIHVLKRLIDNIEC